MKRTTPTAERSLRALSPRDLPAYSKFVRTLSTQSKYQRTLGVSVTPTEQQLLKMLSPVENSEVALGIFLGERLVAVGRFASVSDQQKICEFALTVSDDWQGLGFGTSLLKQLKFSATTAGYEQMVATVFSNNMAMLGLGQAQGFDIRPDTSNEGLHTLQCSLTATSALLNARTPKITPMMSNAIPSKLKAPGISALHR
jgi:acetyltransferase